jgi:hypothetical protein
MPKYVIERDIPAAGKLFVPSVTSRFALRSGSHEREGAVTG